MLKLLIDNGADHDVKDRIGYTPFFVACESHTSVFETVEFL